MTDEGELPEAPRLHASSAPLPPLYPGMFPFTDEPVSVGDVLDDVGGRIGPSQITAALADGTSLEELVTKLLPCRWCARYHPTMCPSITTIEFHENGRPKMLRLAARPSAEEACFASVEEIIAALTADTEQHG